VARILSLTVTLWLATSVTLAGHAGAADDATVGREVEHALGTSHQRGLPGLDPGAEEPDRPRVERELDDPPPMHRERPVDPRTGRPRDPADRAPVAAPPAGPLADLASLLLWGLVAVGAIILGAAVYQQLAGYRGDEETAAPARRQTDAQLAAVIERPRDDADELAAQGRFADAIHTLLLRTLHELASQHLVRVTPSMTSREILARVALLGEAREALAGLIVAVEQTWFGDEVPQHEDYLRCRAQFDRFAAAYRRGAAGASATASASAGVAA
jgi:hypothetical protein